LASRKIIQSFSAFVCNIYLPGFANGHIYQGGIKALCLPGLNCYSCPGAIGACPVGALQSALSGTVLRFPFYVMGTFLAFGLLFGRLICGWLCPFGLVQEMLFGLPTRKMQKSHFTARLCSLKYLLGIGLVVLAPVLLYAAQGIGEPAFCEYFCPAGTLEAAVPLLSMNDDLWAAAGWLTVWKFFILSVFLVIMVFVYRPFCRFACPLGAWYGLFNRQAALGIAVDEQRCTHCGQCAAVCRMDVRIAGDPECISCGACRPICPEHAVYFRKLWYGKNMAEVNKN
jgi:ferredoxin-type protein NapH